MRLSSKQIFPLLFLIICLLNFRWGSTIMGFDNSSPYFSSAATLTRIFSTDNFFHYGGMLFSPAFLLSFLHIPAWLNSQITYLLALFIGLYFSSRLIQFKIKHEVTTSESILISFVLLGNLVPIWAFSIPILIFAPSFAGIATVIYWIVSSQDDSKKSNFWNSFLILIGALYFFSTSINVAAFAIYSVEILIIALLLANKNDYRKTLGKFFIIISIWSIIVQGILLTKTPQRFIITEAIEYGQSLAQDNKSKEVTNSLFSMEAGRNSLINVSRFATGWVSLTDGNNEYIFQYKQFIDSPVGILITMIPVLFVVYYALLRNKTLNRQSKLLFILWLLAVVGASSYFIILFKGLPLVGTVFRWSSSKFWPFLYIPFTILLAEAFFNTKIPKPVKVIMILAIVTMSIPWLFGIVNPHQEVKLPNAYSIVFSKINKTETVLYLPEPQRLYMRQYEWGYYGSGFLTYLTSAKIIDNGSFHPEHNIYSTMVDSFNKCDKTTLKKNISIIVIDNSTITGKIAIPECYKSDIIETTDFLDVIRL